MLAALSPGHMLQRQSFTPQGRKGHVQTATPHQIRPTTSCLDCTAAHFTVLHCTATALYCTAPPSHHQVFKPATTPAAALLAVSPWLSLAMHVFLPSFLFLVCMSQQFHAWSHMKKSELHPAIIALQDANILISRKAHGAHHKPNFDGNYSIVSGWWNPLLDRTGFFRWLEQRVCAATGVEPRCWYAPDHDWAEQVQPGQQ